jgi:hypothetical protein
MQIEIKLELREEFLRHDKWGSLQINSWRLVHDDESLSYCQSSGVWASQDDSGVGLECRASEGLIMSLSHVVLRSSGLEVAC